jgi:hypothetical protein
MADSDKTTLSPTEWTVIESHGVNMNRLNVIQLETRTGEPQTIGDTTITPQSRAVIVRWPRGGFVWNRPIGVIIDRAGQTQRLPIVDVTRYATWTFAGLTLLFSVIINLVAARRRRVHHE